MKATATHRFQMALGKTPKGRVASGHTTMRMRLTPPPYLTIQALAELRNSSDISQSGIADEVAWSGSGLGLCGEGLWVGVEGVR